MDRLKTKAASGQPAASIKNTVHNFTDLNYSGTQKEKPTQSHHISEFLNLFLTRLDLCSPVKGGIHHE